MNIQVGDKVTYKDDENKQICEIIPNSFELLVIQENIKNKNIEILKIERPKYEVMEEKKELLTEEEKEFLKSLLKYTSYEEIKYIKKVCVDFLDFLDNKYSCCFDIRFRKDMFLKLEEDKFYTLEELEL